MRIILALAIGILLGLLISYEIDQYQQEETINSVKFPDTWNYTMSENPFLNAYKNGYIDGFVDSDIETILSEAISKNDTLLIGLYENESQKCYYVNTLNVNLVRFDNYTSAWRFVSDVSRMQT